MDNANAIAYGRVQTAQWKATPLHSTMSVMTCTSMVHTTSVSSSSMNTNPFSLLSLSYQWTFTLVRIRTVTQRSSPTILHSSKSHLLDWTLKTSVFLVDKRATQWQYMYRHLTRMQTHYSTTRFLFNMKKSLNLFNDLIRLRLSKLNQKVNWINRQGNKRTVHFRVSDIDYNYKLLIYII